MSAAVCIFCGARRGNDPVLVEQVQQLARDLAKQGITLVYGGGAVGLMGVAADAALAAGGKVVGVIPGFLDKREIVHPDLTQTIRVNNLFDRKTKMIELSDAFITLPGGMGTFDELLEVLTWQQLGQLDKPIGLFNYQGYFEPFIQMLTKAESAGFYDMDYFQQVVINDQVSELNKHILARI